jgi:carbon monoxide dehydrogenase subunit G
MTHFSTTIEIYAPPARVWAVMLDLERWPEWTSTVTSMTRLDPGPLAVGSRVRICQPKLRPAVWQVTEVDEGQSSTWFTIGPGVRVIARHSIDPIAAGSLVTLSIAFSGVLGPLVARLTRGLNERYLALEANGLKARSEARSDSAPTPHTS